MKKVILILLIIILTLNHNLSFSFDDQDIYKPNIYHTYNICSINSSKINIDAHGYVNLLSFYDTHQIIEVKEGIAFLAPLRNTYDECGQNLSNRGNFGAAAFQSVFGLSFESDNYPYNGLKTTGLLQMTFAGPIDTFTLFGSINTAIEMGTLWQSFIKISKPKDYSILIGLTYSPLFIIDCHPHILSWEWGVPFDPIAKHPQICLTKEFGNLKAILAALGQQNYTSLGPIGPSPSYQRNSLVPMFHSQLRYEWNEDTFTGVAISYKRLIPELVTDKNYKTENSINSIITEAYCKIAFSKKFHISSKFVYAQSGVDQGLLSGYGVENLKPETDLATYTNISAASAWLDITYFTEKFETGAFFGIAKKLKNKHKFYIDPSTQEPIVYELIPNLSSLFKVSPRIFWAFDPIRFGFEISYALAYYGDFNRCANLINLKPSQNWRFLGTVYYLF